MVSVDVKHTSLISLVVSVDVKHTSLISLVVSVDVKHTSLISLVVSVDVKHHIYLLDIHTDCGTDKPLPHPIPRRPWRTCRRC